MITDDEAKAVAACMRYLTDCEQWRVGVLDGVRVVVCPVEPLLASIRAELRLIEQIGEDVIRKEHHNDRPLRTSACATCATAAAGL